MKQPKTQTSVHRNVRRRMVAAHPEMAGPTRDRLIHAAYALFCQYGFHAVGLDQIVKDAGVAKGTFYNHFDSKDALMLAVLQWRDASWPARLSTVLREHAGDRPRDQLKAFIDVLDEIWGTDRCPGCLFLRAAAEFPLPHDPIHVVVHDFVRAVGKALRELAGDAGAQDPAALSRELMVLMTGAYAQSQITDSLRAFETGKRLAKRVLAERLRHRPAANSRAYRPRRR